MKTLIWVTSILTILMTAGCFPVDPPEESHLIWPEEFGRRFEFQCDSGQYHMIGTIKKKDISCMSSLEAEVLASDKCRNYKNRFGESQPLTLTRLSNKFACDPLIFPEEFGTVFQYRILQKSQGEIIGLIGGCVDRDGACISSLDAEALALEKLAWHTIYPPMPMDENIPLSYELDGISNNNKCEPLIYPKEYGREFGYQCTDSIGRSSGASIGKDGACISSSEAEALAFAACQADGERLVRLSNWQPCP